MTREHLGAALLKGLLTWGLPDFRMEVVCVRCLPVVNESDGS